MNKPLEGAAPKKYKTIKETFELPKTRAERAALIVKTLESGGVQKLVAEVGKPLVVRRAVPESLEGLEGDLEGLTTEEDLLDSARNVPMLELQVIGDRKKEFSAFYDMFRAFSEAEKNKATPKTLLVDSAESYHKWTGLHPYSGQSLYGLNVIYSTGLPEEAALLICVDPNDDDAVSLSIRIDIGG